MDRAQEEEILRITAQYVADVQAGKEPDISDYTQRYPHYADALLDFVLYYHSIEAHLPAETELAPLSEISAIALEKAYERTFHARSLASNPHRLTSLLRDAQPPLQASALATLLDLSVDIVLLLEQRGLNPASLPGELYQRLAHTLQLPVEDIRAYLTAPQQAYPLRRKRQYPVRVADAQSQYVAPPDGSSAVPPQQHFRQVIAESQHLSEEQRQIWLAILEHEEL